VTRHDIKIKSITIQAGLVNKKLKYILRRLVGCRQWLEPSKGDYSARTLNRAGRSTGVYKHIQAAGTPNFHQVGQAERLQAAGALGRAGESTGVYKHIQAARTC
jgi:hypothetical protein